MIFRRKMIFCKGNEGWQFLEKECSLSSNCCWRGKTNHEIVSLPLTGDCTDFLDGKLSCSWPKKINYSEALENLWGTLVLWMLYLKTKLLASKLVERKQTEKTDAARICIALEREWGENSLRGKVQGTQNIVKKYIVKGRRRMVWEELLKLGGWGDTLLPRGRPHTAYHTHQ